NQALHSFAGDLPSHRIESGENHRVGGVVDENGDSGRRLKGADVTPLAADDASFNFVALQGESGSRGLKGVSSGVAPDGQTNDPTRFVLGALLGVVNDVT